MATTTTTAEAATPPKTYWVALWTFRRGLLVADADADAGSDYRRIAEALAARVGADPESDGTYWVQVRALPGCKTPDPRAPECDPVPDAETTPREAVELYVDFQRRHGSEITALVGLLSRGTFEWEEEQA